MNQASHITHMQTSRDNDKTAAGNQTQHTVTEIQTEKQRT